MRPFDRNYWGFIVGLFAHVIGNVAMEQAAECAMHNRLGGA